MTNEELRSALETPTKASKKALGKIASEMETYEPERYREILSKKDWEGEALKTYRGYRKALMLSRVLFVLAALIVIGSYLVGDFGMGLLSGWMNRYALAGGVIVAMGLFAMGALQLNTRKERLIAYGILEGI